MQAKLKLNGSPIRYVLVNSDNITVKARKEIRKKFTKAPEVALADDKVVLAELEAEFKTTPPTQKRIYEAFLTLVKPDQQADEDEEDENFFEELCRISCKWEDGGAVLTEEEFQNLPFDMANYILKNLFTDKEKSFLEGPNPPTTA